MRLWTTTRQVAARAIYRAAGFELTGEEPHTGFGETVTGETYSSTSPAPPPDAELIIRALPAPIGPNSRRTISSRTAELIVRAVTMPGGTE